MNLCETNYANKIPVAEILTIYFYVSMWLKNIPDVASTFNTPA
ncbi:MAG: hypothetical protein JWN78_377 [Bacteroidota bacterium]|nr:hypothetical protein [Bacteroidota bacterium]